MQQITEHLYVLPAPFLGIDLFLYVVYSREQVVLIDSGINTTPHEYILPAFRQAGINPALLVCTHRHVDPFTLHATSRHPYPDLNTALHRAHDLSSSDP